MTSINKKLGILLSVAFVFSAFCSSFAVSAQSETPIARVFAASDYQGNTVSASAKQLGAIIGAMKQDGHTSVNGALFAGDYDISMPSSTASGIASAKDVLRSNWSFMPESNMVFVKGNHDPASTAGLSASGAHDTDNYGVFAINESDYMWFNSNKSVIEKTAENLNSYLQKKIISGYSQPIFVVSHLPLHYSMRTKNDGDAQYANLLFDVLNDAGKKGLNIIFLFGHDHSNGWDDYLGGSCIWLGKGDVINIAQSSKTVFKTETLNFTYMNAGYTGYYSGVNSGSERELTSTMFTIYSDRVEICRYNKDGKYRLKGAGVRNAYKNETQYDPDTRTVNSPTTVALQAVEVTPVLTLSRTSGTAAVGGSVALDAEAFNLPNPTYYWESSNPDVFAVYADGRRAAVSALNAGTAEITVTAVSGSSRAGAVCTLTALQPNGKSLYTAVTDPAEIVSGEKYLIAFAGSGSIPKFRAVSHEVKTNNGRTGFTPTDLGISGEAFATANDDGCEWTITGADGRFAVSCEAGTLAITDAKAELRADADHRIAIVKKSDGLYLVDGAYQLSDSSRGVFSGYANGKPFMLYKKLSLPAAPQNVKATVSGSSVTLQWNAARDCCYRVSKDGAAWQTITQTSFRFRDLADGEHTFYVQAVNPFGEGMSAETTVSVDSSAVVRGDADENGKINITDVLVIRQHLSGGDTVINLQNADTDEDGAIGISDVLILRQHLAGVSVE